MFKSVADSLPGVDVMGTAAMRKADAFAVVQGVSSFGLMEAAGAAIVNAVTRRWAARPVAVLCGPGNNGGDGYVAARGLAELGWPVSVFSVTPALALEGDARLAASRWGGPVAGLDSFKAGRFGLIIDALFGAGLSRPLEGAPLRAVETANASRAVKVAIDVPSGVQGDRAGLAGAAFTADLTVTFHRLKPAHLFAPASQLCGEVVCSGIGIPDGWQVDAPPLAEITSLGRVILPDFAHASDRHKHQKGRLCVLAGGPGATSAARLSADAGLVAGAGLVTLLCPPASLIEAAGGNPAIMTRAIREADFAQTLDRHRASAAVLGPGAGPGEELLGRVDAALVAGIPLVLDADAITSLAEAAPDKRPTLHEKVVLTPHAGEFERLFPGRLEQSLTPLDAARDAARECGAVVVLKGPATVIASPDGQAVVNPDASARLATAGSGDVLAGLIGGFLAQGTAPLDAAVTAVWLHGQAGFLLAPGGNAAELSSHVRSVLGAAAAEQARRRILARLAGDT
ncbi:MAG: NAD(P)H-hydrate dehydratase [Caulobacterales bacterium]|uniref:NAD(P)H-hydrate dehydratase n=1 Tax=Glycocaulis sp. TaxID=1969725 RepID=UPI003FA05DE5